MGALVLTALAIANSPLFLTVTVPPNIVVTLDDSGSMQRAYVPEECPGEGVYDCDTLDNRFTKSSRSNLLFYNPNVRYPVPVSALGRPLPVDASGNSLPATTFESAYGNGFDPAFGRVNLATEYRPTATLELRNGTAREGFMGHFSSATSADVRCDESQSPRMCQYRNESSEWINTLSACVGGNAVRRMDSCTGRQDAQGAPPPVRMPAYYYVFDVTNDPACADAKTAVRNNACYDIRFVTAKSGPGTVDLNGDGFVTPEDRDERQNFANWYSFARTRNLATATAASLAFVDLDPSVRVAWQAINTCRNEGSVDTGNDEDHANDLVDSDCDGWKGLENVSNAIRPFVGRHKQDFYDWVAQLPTRGFTPLLRAMNRVGRYYSTAGENGPYDNDFSTPNSGEFQCRRNYHILMTDGIWTRALKVANGDGSTVTLPEPATAPDPDIVRYEPLPPYRDGHENTLADLAFRYSMNDLRGDLDNALTPLIRDGTGSATEQYWNPRNDPFTWQHMVNFTIGLGLTGYLNQAGLEWEGSTYTGSYPAIAAGNTQWPQADATENNPANVADLWHAAINSRGQFFSADDPASLSKAFRSVLNAIGGDSGSAAALSTNSTSIQPGNTRVYQARFNQDWSGTLLALSIDANGTVGEVVWDASRNMPAHSARRIFTSNDVTQQGVEFSACANFSTTQREQLMMDAHGTVDSASCADRMNWVRGDVAKEQRNGGRFRNRPPVTGGATNVMGDVINSDPAYIANVDYGYGTLPAGTPGQSSYAAYVAANATRPAMVYVGANDGQLHGFRASSGIEEFAYIPSGVFDAFRFLTDPGYEHRYSVDGGITVGDAYLNSQWKTVLVAGLNSGGRSVYALDITDPAHFGASNVMWEYTDVDVGLTYSQPQIGILENGQWVAIFGNGYNSSGGGAYLYVVDLQTGDLVEKITAADVPGDEGNGLSTPMLYDADGDKLIDTVYAGDLLGNLWKFDVSSQNSDNWKTAYFDTPLFRARGPGGDIQPITAQPNAGGHSLGGTMVVFGTGRYLTSTDVADKQVQTFYGIWDNGRAILTLDRSELQVQSIDLQTVRGTAEVRSVTGNTPDWGAEKGWYLDLLDPPEGKAMGERVVSPALIRHGRAIFVTLVPSIEPCDPGGSSWLMEVDLLTGGTFPQSVLDLNRDGAFDENDRVGDEVISGLRTDGLGISKTPIWLEGEGRAFKVMTGTGGGFATVINSVPATPTPGDPVTRRSWIQIR